MTTSSRISRGMVKYWNSPSAINRRASAASAIKKGTKIAAVKVLDRNKDGKIGFGDIPAGIRQVSRIPGVKTVAGVGVGLAAKVWLKPLAIAYAGQLAYQYYTYRKNKQKEKLFVQVMQNIKEREKNQRPPY